MNSPSPDQIRQARKNAGLNRKQFGRLVYSTERAVRAWESGYRAMHPGLWELATAKIDMMSGRGVSLVFDGSVSAWPRLITDAEMDWLKTHTVAPAAPRSRD